MECSGIVRQHGCYGNRYDGDNIRTLCVPQDHGHGKRRIRVRSAFISLRRNFFHSVRSVTVTCCSLIFCNSCDLPFPAACRAVVLQERKCQGRSLQGRRIAWYDDYFIDPYGDNLLHWNELAVLRIRRASFPGTPVLHTGSFGPCHSSCCHKILQGRCKDLYCRHDNARHRAYIGFDLVLLAVLWNSNVLPRRCLRRINHIIRHGNVHILYA